MSALITIVGAGTHGSRLAGKYRKFPDVRLKAVVSRSKPTSAFFYEVPFMTSASEWKRNFKSPGKNDIFDLCVHQNILSRVLEDFARIGAKNFILPKPIALTKKELDQILALQSKYNLKIAASSQWHYSSLVAKVGEFIDRNKKKISKINLTFSDSFDEKRRITYNPHTAFLPHIVQILHTLGLVTAATGVIVEDTSDTKIRIKYAGKYNITAESDINSKKRNQTLEIYLDGKATPALIADFSGITNSKGFVKYPTIIINGKKMEVQEDLLERMIEKKLSYFGGLPKEAGASGRIMSLQNYLPVAEGIIKIVDRSSQLVTVIGGGVFGIMSALEIAQKGYSVVIFEKEKEILTGASLVNHCRVHMGYHYPRDERTARESKESRSSFEKTFGRKVVRKLDNYYLVAKEGSLTTAEDFLAFCKKLDLPYKEEWPKSFRMSRDKISLSVKVPEPIFDANRKRQFLLDKIASMPNVTLRTGVSVTGLVKTAKGYEIKYETGKIKGLIHCAAVVNATYGGMNHINSHLGLPLQEFQYELCEIPVVKAPWKGSAWMIIDGPFFSVMPFGYSDKHLFYDVELSVLERFVGKFPEFKKGVAYYDSAKRRADRFKKYLRRWSPWVSGMEAAKQVYSMYVTRVVLPKRERTDERPTIINQLLPGFWQIFSGKIVTSVPSTKELAGQIDNFLKNKQVKVVEAPLAMTSARLPQ